jgi:hypothetical protein
LVAQAFTDEELEALRRFGSATVAIVALVTFREGTSPETGAPCARW